MLSLPAEELVFAELQAPVHWVRGPRALTHLVDALAKVPNFAIDTETGGVAQLKEPLNARLSLIQLYIPKRDRWGNVSPTRGRLVVIDVLRLEQLAAQRGSDEPILEPLRRVLADPAIKKVIHHEAFEREQFARRNLNLVGVIDTERLSRKLRSDLLSHSLGAVDFELRQVALDKGLQDSQWLKRPLDPEQQRYAALDPQETYHVWRALEQLEQAIALDCEASLDGYCRELAKTRALRNELLQQGNLDILCPRLERAIELTRATIKQAAERVYANLDQKVELLNIPSNYGSVVIAPHYTSKIDLDKLTRLHPQVAQEVIKSRCTQDELTKALRASGHDAKQTKGIIDNLYALKSEPISAKVEPITPSVDWGDQEILQAFGIAIEQAPQQLMQKLVLLSAQILALKRQAGIANQLAVIERRAELLEKLIEEEVAQRAQDDPEFLVFESEQIKVDVKRSTKRQLDIEQLSSEYPQIAATLLRPAASIKDLRSAFSDRGMSESEVDVLVDELSFKVSASGKPSVSIYPHYGVIYHFSRPKPQSGQQNEAAAA